MALLVLRPIFRNIFDFDGDDDFRGQFNLGGIGLISYIILWIVLPKRDDAPEPISTLASTGRDSAASSPATSTATPSWRTTRPGRDGCAAARPSTAVV